MAVTRLEARHAARVGATLGEGPVWVARDRALWFVDIVGRRVHRFDPATGELRGWDAPAPVGWVLPSDDGGFVAGLQGGLHRFDPATGRFAPLHAVEAHLPDNRLNDAAIDASGAVWFGTMDDTEAAVTGRLYRFHRGAVTDSGLAPVGITNGPAIAPDGRTLYAVDTLGRTIDAHAIDGEGRLGPPRRFVAIDPADGYPDGATCDAAGGVWIGLFGGGAARRYAAGGALTHEVRFPVANVTKVALGGPDGRTGYATTARKGLDATALAAQPLAGDLFAFPVDVAAVPTREVALA